MPCGYGTTFSTMTTNAQEEEGSTSSTEGTYGGSCIECPPGMECPGGGVFQECEPGTHAPGGGPSNVCMPCFPGSFANSTASAECTECPAGKRGLRGTGCRGGNDGSRGGFCLLFFKGGGASKGMS